MGQVFGNRRTLENAVDYGDWKRVSKFLERGVSQAQYIWAAKKACGSADDETLREILSLREELPESVVYSATLNKRWQVLRTVIKSEFRWRWAVKEAIEKADNPSCYRIVHGGVSESGDLDFCVEQAVQNDRWELVLWCLEGIRPRGLTPLDYIELRNPKCLITPSETVIQYAVAEAAVRAEETVLRDILRHATDREPVMTKLLERGLWRLGSTFFASYSTHIFEEKPEHLLKGLVTKGWWSAAGQLFKTCMDNTQPVDVNQKVDEPSDNVNAEEPKAAFCPHLEIWAGHFVKSLGEISFSNTAWSHHEEKSRFDEFLAFQQNCFRVLMHCSECTRDNGRNDQKNTTKSLISRWEQHVRMCVPEEKIMSGVEGLLGNLSEEYLDSTGQLNVKRGEFFTCIFALQTINTPLQSLAVRTLTRTYRSEVSRCDVTRLDVITNLSLSRVWEEERRSLFQAAVEQREWTIVKQLADHSLYDDQRDWALGEALRERQMAVFMLLADHGLTEDQLRRVYRQVAKHADWNTVLELFERGADVLLVSEELETANPSRERLPTEDEMEKYERKFEDNPALENEYRERWQKIEELEARYRKRCRKLRALERRLETEKQDFDNAVKQKNWRAVLHRLRRTSTQEQARLALDHAVQSEAWHVVVQLVKLSMDADERETFLPEAIRRRQWGVARALLERGVSAELCLNVLPELIKEGQWILVARVMEHGVSDDQRRQIIQEGLDHREGSVVAHCISIMEGTLTVEEREAIFERSLRHGLWQAVRRLVEEKDSTGIAQRDKALIESVWRHKWDVVEHCLQLGADIDKPDTEGNALVQQAARKNDWITVEGLLYVGADQFVLDTDGYTLLDRAIECQNWAAAKMLVKFHGDINKPGPDGYTPLYKLIQYEQADIIDCALDWGRNVAHKVDCFGETALHVLCQGGYWDSLRYIIARGADPLAVARGGESVLLFAVNNKQCPEKLVAACIKLGIASFQPKLTDTMTYATRADTSCVNIEVCSPFQQALYRSDLALVQMLYESGACSNAEFHRMAQRLFVDNDAITDAPMSVTLSYDPDEVKEFDSRIFPYMRKILSPRSLQSLCRLTISRQLGIRPRRHKMVNTLPLPRRMKDYVMFADLTVSRPDIGQIPGLPDHREYPVFSQEARCTRPLSSLPVDPCPACLPCTRKSRPMMGVVLLA
ncbi:hypothetical protein BaRGS_00030277 [Batillaria attramentaria]|uniref:SOCS box domain-containing protein n=1 Tax=Batillaria attramentaria TaxID=370345 RepID=A0ABD0JUC7_9CAEN